MEKMQNGLSKEKIMGQLCLVLLLSVMVATPALAETIMDKPEITPVATDQLYIVDDPGGTPADGRATIQDAVNSALSAPGAIGGTTPAAGTFTTLTGSSITDGSYTLNGDGTITNLISDDESTNDDHEIVFSTDNETLESDGDLIYNPSTGLLTSTNMQLTGLGIGAAPSSSFQIYTDKDETATSGTKYGSAFTYTAKPSGGNSTAVYYGLYSSLAWRDDNSLVNPGHAIANIGYAGQTGSDASTAYMLIGTEGYVSQGNANGTITNAIGVAGNYDNSGGGTIDTFTAFFMPESSSDATNEYSFYSLDSEAKLQQTGPARFDDVITLTPQTYDASDADNTDCTIGTTFTSSTVIITGDDDSDNDEIDLQDGTEAGQILIFIAGSGIDGDDTITIDTTTDSTCTGCAATVLDATGDSRSLIWLGTTWAVWASVDAP